MRKNATGKSRRQSRGPKRSVFKRVCALFLTGTLMLGMSSVAFAGNDEFEDGQETFEPARDVTYNIDYAIEVPAQVYEEIVPKPEAPAEEAPAADTDVKPAVEEPVAVDPEPEAPEPDTLNDEPAAVPETEALKPEAADVNEIDAVTPNEGIPGQDAPPDPNPAAEVDTNPEPEPEAGTEDETTPYIALPDAGEDDEEPAADTDGAEGAAQSGDEDEPAMYELGDSLADQLIAMQAISFLIADEAGESLPDMVDDQNTVSETDPIDSSQVDEEIVEGEAGVADVTEGEQTSPEPSDDSQEAQPTPSATWNIKDTQRPDGTVDADLWHYDPNSGELSSKNWTAFYDKENDVYKITFHIDENAEGDQTMDLTHALNQLSMYANQGRLEYEEKLASRPEPTLPPKPTMPKVSSVKPADTGKKISEAWEDLFSLKSSPEGNPENNTESVLAHMEALGLDTSDRYVQNYADYLVAKADNALLTQVFNSRGDVGGTGMFKDFMQWESSYNGVGDPTDAQIIEAIASVHRRDAMMPPPANEYSEELEKVWTDLFGGYSLSDNDKNLPENVLAHMESLGLDTSDKYLQDYADYLVAKADNAFLIKVFATRGDVGGMGTFKHFMRWESDYNGDGEPKDEQILKAIASVQRQDAKLAVPVASQSEKQKKESKDANDELNAAVERYEEDKAKYEADMQEYEVNLAQYKEDKAAYDEWAAGLKAEYDRQLEANVLQPGDSKKFEIYLTSGSKHTYKYKEGSFTLATPDWSKALYETENELQRAMLPGGQLSDVQGFDAQYMPESHVDRATYHLTLRSEPIQDMLKKLGMRDYDRFNGYASYWDYNIRQFLDENKYEGDTVEEKLNSYILSYYNEKDHTEYESIDELILNNDNAKAELTKTITSGNKWFTIGGKYIEVQAHTATVNYDTFYQQLLSFAYGNEADLKAVMGSGALNSGTNRFEYENKSWNNRQESAQKALAYYMNHEEVWQTTDNYFKTLLASGLNNEQATWTAFMMAINIDGERTGNDWQNTKWPWYNSIQLMQMDYDFNLKKVDEEGSLIYAEDENGDLKEESEAEFKIWHIATQTDEKGNEVEVNMYLTRQEGSDGPIYRFVEDPNATVKTTRGQLNVQYALMKDIVYYLLEWEAPQGYERDTKVYIIVDENLANAVADMIDQNDRDAELILRASAEKGVESIRQIAENSGKKVSKVESGGGYGVIDAAKHEILEVELQMDPVMQVVVGTVKIAEDGIPTDDNAIRFVNPAVSPKPTPTATETTSTPSPSPSETTSTPSPSSSEATSTPSPSSSEATSTPSPSSSEATSTPSPSPSSDPTPSSSTPTPTASETPEPVPTPSSEPTPSMQTPSPSSVVTPNPPPTPVPTPNITTPPWVSSPPVVTTPVVSPTIPPAVPTSETLAEEPEWPTEESSEPTSETLAAEPEWPGEPTSETLAEEPEWPEDEPEFVEVSKLPPPVPIANTPKDNLMETPDMPTDTPDEARTVRHAPKTDDDATMDKWLLLVIVMATTMLASTALMQKYITRRQPKRAREFHSRSEE